MTSCLWPSFMCVATRCTLPRVFILMEIWKPRLYTASQVRPNEGFIDRTKISETHMAVTTSVRKSPLDFIAAAVHWSAHIKSNVT